MMRRPVLWVSVSLLLTMVYVVWFHWLPVDDPTRPSTEDSTQQVDSNVPHWECQPATQYVHQVHFRSETALQSSDASVPAQEWFFTTWGQIEETCLTERNPFHGEKRWLVHYRWLAEGLEQNIQSSDLQLQAEIYQTLRDGVYVERTATDILNLNMKQDAHEASYDIWRSFLLSQIQCQQAKENCHETWLNDTYTARYEALSEAHSWQKHANVMRSYRHLNHEQSLTTKIIAARHRVAEIDMILHSEQETAWAKTKDSTRIQSNLIGSQQVPAATLQSLKQAKGETRSLQHAVHANQNQNDDVEKIYRKEIANINLEDLWSELNQAEERTSRYLQVKAWVYLHRDELQKISSDLRTRPADDELLRLWLKALSQTGGLPGQELLVQTLVERAHEKNLAKYTLAALAFADEPADEMDQLLQHLLDDERVGDELHVNILLALGTWAGRLTGERAERLSRFLLERWPTIHSQEEKLALIQAIGNSGFSGAKGLLLQISASENSPRLLVEAVFALRFVEDSLEPLLNFLDREPHRQGAIRALRFVSFSSAQAEYILKRAHALNDPVIRYQVISSLLQNPRNAEISIDRWQLFLEAEKNDEVRKIIENYLRRERHSGS